MRIQKKTFAVARVLEAKPASSTGNFETLARNLAMRLANARLLES